MSILSIAVPKFWGPKIDFLIPLLKNQEICKAQRNEGIFDLADHLGGRKWGKNGHFEISLESGREVSETRTIEGIFDLAAREVVFFEKVRQKYFRLFRQEGIEIAHLS